MKNTALNQFIADQKAELQKSGWFKSYTSCANCGSSFIFKNNDLKNKKVCVCQSNNWIIERIVEC